MTVHCREGIHLQACICDTNGCAHNNMAKDTKQAHKSGTIVLFSGVAISGILPVFLCDLNYY